MLTLYWGSGSPFAWRVMLALEIKKVAYTGKLVSFSSGELKTPELLAISPRAQVPILVDGDYSLTESLAILQYIESRYPEPALFGRNAEETGKIWNSIQMTGGYIEAAGFAVARPIFSNTLEEKHEQVIEARKTLETELTRINNELSSGYLVGDSITAADISLYPLLQYMARAVNKTDIDTGGKLYNFPENFKSINAWNKMIESIQGYEKTYPPHWK